MGDGTACDHVVDDGGCHDALADGSWMDAVFDHGPVRIGFPLLKGEVIEGAPHIDEAEASGFSLFAEPRSVEGKDAVVVGVAGFLCFAADALCA